MVVRSSFVDQRQLLRLRELRVQRDRLSAVISSIESGGWGCLSRRGSVKPKELALFRGCSQQAANVELNQLYHVGLLDRSRVGVPGGGKAYVYRLTEEARRFT